MSKGGADAWSPSITPPIGVDLTDEQKLACSFRILAREGFSENIAGHITWANADNSSLMVNPWGLWW
ncbi:MAG TPA: aldolase, partial [Acidimicrobiaceae bacterium]|nr:aldolase [Acidimicrobiaceae bacterium]